MKRFLLTICSLLLGVFVALAVTEILARNVFTDFADNATYLDRALARLLNSGVIVDPNSDNYHPRYGFVFSPNSQTAHVTDEFSYTVRTNSLGFRTREIAPKTDAEYRIMLVGDSMFWGVGVERPETIATLVRKMGESLQQPTLSVYNYSVSGYNTVQELLVARDHVAHVEPDHIILGFFIANDIIPNAIASVDGTGNYTTSAAMINGLKNDIKERFGVFFNSVVFRILAFHAYVPRLRHEIATSDEIIERSYALLKEFNGFAKRNQSRFSVVIFHPLNSVQGGVVTWWTKSRETGKKIHAFCQQQAIEALDLSDYMNTREHLRFFFQKDGHLNREGNHVVAEAIFNDLVKNKLIQQKDP